MDLTLGPGSRNRNYFNRLVVVEVLNKHYTPWGFSWCAVNSGFVWF